MSASRRCRRALLLSTLKGFIASSAFQNVPSTSRRYLCNINNRPMESILAPIFTSLEFSSSSNEQDDPLPPVIESPVLAAAYPAILSYKSQYGHPNIPLGSENGKRCKTLRRLAFQNKLSPEEIELLTDLGFRFNSFEDVYTECDFDEMREKLIAYHEEKGTFQIPKKYEFDPELGAWVTMLRRLYRTGDLPAKEVEKMDEIQFEWVSTRKCGSSFMTRYREILEQLNDVVSSDGDVSKVVEEDLEIKKWIHAQKSAFENGRLSDSRVQYMDDLPGVDWRHCSL